MTRHINLKVDKNEFRKKLGVKDGKDGKDGSPDTPDEVVGKVNKAKKKIRMTAVESLPSFFQVVDQLSSNPAGRGIGVWNPRIKSNGTLVSAHMTELDFTTGLSATYSGSGKITVAVSTVSDLVVLDEALVDTGDRTTWNITSDFTAVHSVHFQRLHMSGSGIDYTVSGTQIVFNAALPGTSTPIVTLLV